MLTSESRKRPREDEAKAGTVATPDAEQTPSPMLAQDPYWNLGVVT